MAAQSLALEQCFNEVADSAPMALERCLTHVVAILQQAESSSVGTAERTELGEAWRELLAHQAGWCKRYPDDLRTAFKSEAQARPGALVPRRGNQVPKVDMELSLVDDADIIENIESSRLTQHMLPMVERPISELDALVSSAMGLPTVQPELNPVRPEVFAQTLRALIGRAQVKRATGSLWMKYLAEPLGRELQDIYGRLVTQLKDAKVRAAGYRVMPTSGARSAPAQNAPMAAPSPSAAQNPYSNLSSQQISHALLRNFLADAGGEQASQALPDSYYAEVERELALLKSQAASEQEFAMPELPQAYRDLPVVERQQRQVGVETTLSTRIWGGYARSHERSLVRSRLRKDAKRVAQVLGLELVRKVVNQIAQDPRLLSPVREAIVALEPSLLRLAMIDPRFFSEERHPGRRLMETVAQRSFNYNDEFSTEFTDFFQEVSRSFNELNQLEIQNSQPFEQALVQLETLWNAQDQLRHKQRGQAVDAMRFVERRQLEAERIVSELKLRPDLDKVPAVVQDFLFDLWALVMAHARLTDKDNRIDPHGYGAAISHLLWSVKPEVTLRQPAQLFQRVPALVGTLRAGLASLGQGPDENEVFFRKLEKLHLPVLDLRREKSRRDARESGAAPLMDIDIPSIDLPLVEAPAKPATGQLWMSPDELNATGFQETQPTDVAELMDDAGTAAESPAAALPITGDPSVPTERSRPSPVSEGMDVLANLREGDWVDLYSKRNWLRAQLIWASTKGSLFMFVSHGGQPHSMTRRICERLIRDRYLRPLRMDGVVAQALGVLDYEISTP